VCRTLKPSDGLELPTPSLPFFVRGGNGGYDRELAGAWFSAASLRRGRVRTKPRRKCGYARMPPHEPVFRIAVLATADA
jgi:hypothetical protein